MHHQRKQTNPAGFLCIKHANSAMSFNWKAYLKPSLKKAAIAAVFFILFVPFLEYDNGIRCIRAPCPSSSHDSIFFWLFPQDGAPAAAHIYSLDFLVLIVGAIICYLIACRIAQMFSAPALKEPHRAGEKQTTILEKILLGFQEFLKPTVSRLQLALVMFVLFAPFFNYANNAACVPCPSGTACPACPATKTGSFIDTLFSPERNYQLANFLDFEKLVELALSALVSYFLACYFASKFGPFIPKPRAKAQ